jgi:cyclic dehypoxanthinyl futalosine synthase
MLPEALYKKIIKAEQLNEHEALILWNNVSLAEIIHLANELRFEIHPHKNVTWLIDRNVNITNVCFSQCSFCNFCVRANHPDAYVLTMDDYRKKINELFLLGGRQLLLQGGMNPNLGLNFYTELFSKLKSEFPEIKLHALGPPEVHWLAKKENLSYYQVLSKLREAGLDSLPGAGAEILTETVREIVSPAKASAQEWLDVMSAAHQMGIVTSATMMFGFIETVENRIEHLIKIRELQNLKPAESKGFIAFIPWPFQRLNTKLISEYPELPEVFGAEYLKMVAFSRIMLPNIPHIGASWLTVGKDVAKMALHAGADDLGSVMIEENVVSAAGAHYQITPEEMQNLISSAGFNPVKRDQNYRPVND